MSMWTAIALIAIASIVAGIFNDKGKKKNRQETEREIEAIQVQLDALESNLRGRVETLERIVTNPKEDLKRKFDHLDKAS
jgi:uncharacterized membrane-anchored protein YhcB (DUF1043 family)